MYKINKIKDNSLNVPLPLWFLYLYFIKRSWLHCNPSNKKLIEIDNLKHYFIENDEMYFNDKKTNTKFKLSNFEEVKSVLYSDEKYKISFIFGEKGYGKTTIQNNLLINYTRSFNKEGVTWIRVDASKIYCEWARYRHTSFIRYLYIQMVYVYIRYYSLMCDESDHDKIFKSKFEEIKKDLQNNNLEDTFNDFKNKITSSSKCLKHSKAEQKNVLEKEIKKTAQIAKILFNHLASSIILIVDGIDNLDYTNGYRKTITEQINTLLQRTKNEGEFSLRNFKSITFFLREENKKFFHNFFKNEEQKEVYGNNEDYIADEYNINNISFGTLIEKIRQNLEANIPKNDVSDKELTKKIIEKLKKDYDDLKIDESEKKLPLEYATSNFAVAIENSLEITASKLVTIIKNDSEIFDFLKDYETYIKCSLKHKGINTDDIDVTRDFFYNSYREMLSHAIKSYVYIKTFMLRKQYAKNSDINGYLSSDAKYLLVMEASFKNGNLYGITNKDFSYMAQFKNISFTNLFNIEISENFTVHPIEVIIVLISLKNKLTVNYSDDKTKTILEKLEEFSYIKFDINSQKYLLAKKGEIIFTYSFRDINILNTYCYGGIFYENDICNLETYGSKWENYISGMLYNVTYMIGYLENEIKSFFLSNEIKKELEDNIYNSYLKADFLAFYSKLDRQGRRELDRKLQENGLFQLFTLMLGIKNFEKVTAMSEIEFIKMAKRLESIFENYQNAFEYKMLLLRVIYMQNIESILSKHELQTYLFGDYASIFTNEHEYQARKAKCEDIKIDISILQELDDLLNNEFLTLEKEKPKMTKNSMDYL